MAIKWQHPWQRVVTNSAEVVTFIGRLHLEPIFKGAAEDRFKALYWTKSSFLLLYKRFENGYMQWPRDRSEIQRLNYRQMSRLVSGLAVEERRTIQAITPGHLY